MSTFVQLALILNLLGFLAYLFVCFSDKQFSSPFQHCYYHYYHALL